jgi:hypothetical protein
MSIRAMNLCHEKLYKRRIYFAFDSARLFPAKKDEFV